MSEINESYKSLDEIKALVNRFETCEIEPSEFSHRAHLTVALWYLAESGYDEAEKRMREGLYRFLSHYSLEGYNETITLFWLKFLQSFLAQQKEASSRLNLVNDTVGACGNSKRIFQYYSREFLMSDEAKKRWVEPDLSPLDF